MNKSFSSIGIVGFKDKSADLACALKQITSWALEHPQVKFYDSRGERIRAAEDRFAACDWR